MAFSLILVSSLSLSLSPLSSLPPFCFARSSWLLGGGTHAITPYAHGWELVRGGGGWSHGYDWGAGSDIIVVGIMVE